MQKYKVKSIFNNHMIVEYRTSNGSLKEIYVFIEPDWSKERIEEEVARQKLIEDKRDIKVNIAQYFSKGEELEFINLPTEEERRVKEIEQWEKEHKEIIEEENKKFLEKITQYRSTPVNYDQVRWYSYPSIEEQLDALYWMRQGIMEPIQEIDAKILEVKSKYPKNEPTNLTCGDLDTMFPGTRPTEYIDELKSRNIQADFL